MKTPQSLQAHATALFSRERRRQRLAEFIASFDRAARPSFPAPVPAFVPVAKAPTQAQPGSAPEKP